MAITAPKKLSDFSGFIKPEQAEAIFNDAAKMSAAQQLMRQVPLGASGKAFPMVTAKPTANWTDEAGKKHTTEASLGLVTMEPKKLTAIAVTSAEVVRANPGGYSETLRSLLAEAFANAFDLAVFHNKGGDGTGTGPFAHYLAETSKSVTLASGGNLYDELVAAMALNTKGNPKKKVTGFAFDSSIETDFLGQKDTAGRPLFVSSDYEDGATGLISGRLLGRRAFMQDGVANGTTVGFLGDWSKAAWGTVGGISYDVSTETAVTINGELTSLWENNLVAIRAEAEYGFVVADTAAFVKLVTA